MSRRLLLPVSVGLLIITPVLAEDPPATPANPVITRANERKAEADALKAQYDAQKAAAEARLAPLSRFAGTGQNQIEAGAGAMEAAYLAAVSMGDAARAINRRVLDYVDRHPAPAEPADIDGPSGRGLALREEQREALRAVVENPDEGDTIQILDEAEAVDNDGPAGDEDRRPAPATAPAQIVLLAGDEALSFDAYAAFRSEAEGIVHAAVRALRATGPRCTPPRRPVRPNANSRFMVGPGTVATVGALIGLLQSDTHVYGFTDLGDEELLVSAITAERGDFYIRQAELLAASPDPGDRVRRWLDEVAVCEAALRAEIQRQTPANQTDAQKARVAEMAPVLTHIGSFNTRLTTPATDGKILLGAVLRQSLLQSTSSPYVLRVRVDRAGGTMITAKNLWTALGAPAIRLSGGVIASYSLSNRRSGRILLGGTVICRTGLTGLRSAIALRHSDIVCAENPPRNTAVNAPRGRRGRPARLGYDDSIFRLTEQPAFGGEAE